jgi:hypothetical protein
VTLVLIVVAVVASGAASVVAPATPVALGDSVFFMELLNAPTIISIVGVTLVEDAVAASSTLVTLGAVSAMLLLVGLRREGSCLIALGIL